MDPVVQPVSQSELLSRVRELRAAGLSPKQVARQLGMKPAQVAPLIRQVAGSYRTAADQRPLPEPADRDLVGCWVNPGWSAGLGLDHDLDQAAHWAAADPEGADQPPAGGLVKVLVARADRSSRVTICGWMVDVYCLGVKDSVGPKTISSSALLDHCRQFFRGYDHPPRTAPLELAQHLVHGVVAYARSLGFEPDPRFPDTVAYLGRPTDPCPITFGREGTPFYIAGPHDNPHAVIATLQATAGAGNYHYLTHL
jgi:hypothetical protein